MILVGFLFVLLCIGLATGEYTVALVPKSVDNPFFDVSRDGCYDAAQQLGIKCLWVGPSVEDRDGTLQAKYVSDLITNGTVHGIGISVKSVEAMTPLISQAVLSRIPVVTFDSDAPLSLRAAYIGTDNKFFGRQMGKLVKQLHPEGGTFGILSVANTPNINERENGVRDELMEEGGWVEAVGSPADSQANLTLGMELLHEFARQNVTAIVPVMGAPMRSGTWKQFVDEHRFRNISLVNGDAMQNQLEFLDRNYVHGLIGQLPYEMGSLSVRVLYDLIRKIPIKQEVYGTNVVSHIFVPLVLPELAVDRHLIGNLAYVGYTLLALIVATSVACIVWTFQYRNLTVVQLAQPNFLVMIATGALLLGFSIVPLSKDDGGIPLDPSDTYGTAICTSVPWLTAIGFTVIFSALYSKTRRINKIFHSQAGFTRVKVTEKEVLAPFVFLLTANIIVLVCWTVMDPLVYVRKNHDGTDGWNRVVSTYGTCSSERMILYLLPLGILNFGVLIMANWQAYEARQIESDFSESKYIGIAMASMSQAVVTGVPILFIVRKMPEAVYLTLTFIIFIICMAILSLIFVPKMIAAHNFSKQSITDQRNRIRQSIRRSQSPGSRRSFTNVSRHSFNNNSIQLPSKSRNESLAEEGAVSLRNVRRPASAVSDL